MARRDGGGARSSTRCSAPPSSAKKAIQRGRSGRVIYVALLAAVAREEVI
jgi:hypothetical protein